MAYSPSAKAFNLLTQLDRSFSFKIEKRPGQAYRLLRGLLIVVIVLTLVGNLIFILDSSTNLFSDRNDDGSNLRQHGGRQPVLPRMIERDEGEQQALNHKSAALYCFK